MIQCLLREHTSKDAAEILNKVARLSARYLGDRGFSIGINDVTPSEKLRFRKNRLVQSGYEKCEELIRKYKDPAVYQITVEEVREYARTNFHVPRIAEKYAGLFSEQDLSVG